MKVFGLHIQKFHDLRGSPDIDRSLGQGGYDL